MTSIIDSITSAATRRERVRDAEAEEIGRILDEAHKTTDPVKLVALKRELNGIDPRVGLDAMLTAIDMLTAAKPKDRDDKATQKALAASVSAIEKKRREREEAIARFDREIEQAEAKRHEAAIAHASATVHAKRYEALKTGVPSESAYGQFTDPGLRAWARRVKFI